jgi:hypothetical protein
MMRLSVAWMASITLLTQSAVYQTRAQPSAKKSLHAFLAVRKGAKQATTFSADVPVIYVFWKGERLNAGDKIGVAWIAEDVHGDARKDTEIRRADAVVFKQNENGEFSLSRPPDKLWPLGKYRVELYVNGGIAEVAKFTINSGVTIEVR